MPRHIGLDSSQPAAASEAFLSLALKVRSGTTRRSENDLSSKLAAVLGDLELHTVVDTSVATAGRKRPDILAYVSQDDADLVLPAEVVIEAKLPDEVAEFASLREAVVSDKYWADKTFPYLRDNLPRVQYFAFTTFSEFAVVSITPEIRRMLVQTVQSGEQECADLRTLILENCTEFKLGGDLPEADPRSASAWMRWLGSHCRPEHLSPPPLSEVRNSIPVETQQGLEAFAAQLAAFAAGVSDGDLRNAGLYHSISARIPKNLAELPPTVKKDLLIFLMAQHPGLSIAGAGDLAEEQFEESVDEFIAASIHSLISRCFAIKAIEDAFCIEQEEPLIEAEHWLFPSGAYDNLSAIDIRTAVFVRIRGLAESVNPVVRQFAQFGFFFDWIETYIDPVLFRSLLEIFAVHDFTHIEGDVLGRFYELYAQEINRSRRKALGQYYTPLPVVQFVWWLAERLVIERGVTETITVLDPAMGSGTFLSHGARVLAAAKIPAFWKRLTGFDVSAQVMGIAHVNFYMAVLSQLDPTEATGVTGLQIYTTDALDHRNGKRLREILPLVTEADRIAFIQQQIAVSSEAKQAGNFYLVIGNPPYRNNSSRTLTQVAEQFPRLLKKSADNARAQERQIRDDYAWFFAAADHYIRDSGLICYIVSDSFATLASYRYFRESLLRNYYVRHLVRLGGSVFQDVGYRMTFAVVLLERREQALAELTDLELIPVSDLRPLIDQTPQAELGTESDPRFRLMRAVVAGQQELTITDQHVPDAGTSYTLYPHTGLTDRIRREGLLIHDRGPNRIFVHKWPGLITAFDSLFKASTRGELEHRIQGLFKICRDSNLTTSALPAAISGWGKVEGFQDDELGRLSGLGVQIRQSNLRFKLENIKRSVSGSMRADAKWYPPKENTQFVYYEPSLHIPRNANPGKRVGWGTMEQWREPASHRIAPKLIYSTASRVEHGYKGFVVRDEWYVKLHGGTRQQFHYTGIHNPLEPPRADELPNNLTDAGLRLTAQLCGDGAPVDSILYYVAAICNSSIAADLLTEIGSGVPLHIRVPRQHTAIQQAVRVADVARRACALSELAYHLPAGDGIVPAAVLGGHITPALLNELGLAREEIARRGFKSQVVIRVSADTTDRVAALVDQAEDEIDTLIMQIYS